MTLWTDLDCLETLSVGLGCSGNTLGQLRMSEWNFRSSEIVWDIVSGEHHPINNLYEPGLSERNSGTAFKVWRYFAWTLIAWEQFELSNIVQKIHIGQTKIVWEKLTSWHRLSTRLFPVAGINCPEDALSWPFWIGLHFPGDSLGKPKVTCWAKRIVIEKIWASPKFTWWAELVRVCVCARAHTHTHKLRDEVKHLKSRFCDLFGVAGVHN